MKLLYFARFRQILGKGEEAIELPADIRTANELITWLRVKDEAYDLVFSDTRIVRVAIDREHSNLDASIIGAREVAFFPPVTGG